ncbi:hypothetical protein ABFT23_07065 [Nocardioides sp. C4-1]|uniref:hypothetical protein n=1 Tax=Nocardioides sp. C4-1 TaxID=3151851 RepID=UPI0032641D2C
MRRLLVPALLLLPVLLVGCGQDADEAADDATDAVSESSEPATSEPTSSTPSEPATDLPTRSPPITPGAPDGGDYTVVAIESATAAGGRTELEATPVGPGAGEGPAELLSQLSDATFRETIEQSISTSRAEGELYAAVVAVGCDVPPGVTVTRVDGVVTITPEKVAKPLPNCFAPVTTVAVVAVG